MDEPRGILRVTRHPSCGGSRSGGVHLISRGDLASLIFFGGFLLLASRVRCCRIGARTG